MEVAPTTIFLLDMLSKTLPLLLFVELRIVFQPKLDGSREDHCRFDVPVSLCDDLAIDTARHPATGGTVVLHSLLHDSNLCGRKPTGQSLVSHEDLASRYMMDGARPLHTQVMVGRYGIDHIKVMQKLAKEVADVMKQTKGTVDVDDGLEDMEPQLTISVDKEKAAEYGYTVAQVYQLVSAKMADSKSATTISTDIKDYKVYVQTQEQTDTKLDDIRQMTFTHTDKDGKEKEIPLTKICEMKDTTTLSTMKRDAQTRYITVSCGVDEDHNVTLLGNKIQKSMDKLNVPEGYHIEMTGEDETISDSMSQLVLMMILAVIFIYLIMVVQFQSLVSPFIIMFSIPLAFTGGFIALLLTGQEVNVLAMLGFIMLAGLIVNNGIVLIDYINQARKAGVSKHEAIISSGKTRVRPILMTVLTTVLAMLTTALGIGDGSDMMRPMAITLIGGLVYGTVLTLIVIPCIYDMFHREKNMVEEEL